MHRSPIERIVSGGQTGVDRAALDVAIALGVPHGGWCPRGRLAEDGPIAEHYELRETESAAYHVRTEQNVVDSDGTLILHRGPLQGGTALTFKFAARHWRPCLTIELAQAEAAGAIRDWIAAHAIRILNIAGPRESSVSGIYAEAVRLLEEVFATS